MLKKFAFVDVCIHSINHYSKYLYVINVFLDNCE